MSPLKSLELNQSGDIGSPNSPIVVNHPPVDHQKSLEFNIESQFIPQSQILRDISQMSNVKDRSENHLENVHNFSRYQDVNPNTAQMSYGHNHSYFQNLSHKKSQNGRNPSNPGFATRKKIQNVISNDREIKKLTSSYKKSMERLHRKTFIQ